MKFTVEVEDFWLDEEDLDSALKKAVTSQVIAEIKKQIESKVEVELTKQIKETVEKKIAPIVQKTLTKLVDDGVLTVGSEKLTFAKFIQNSFDRGGWSSPQQQIGELAEKYGKELKLRYDALFANRIVNKLKEQGMLNDDVVKYLIKD